MLVRQFCINGIFNEYAYGCVSIECSFTVLEYKKRMEDLFWKHSLQELTLYSKNRIYNK